MGGNPYSVTKRGKTINVEPYRYIGALIKELPLQKTYNAACEGFFGRPKMELFYPRDWRTPGIEQSIQMLDFYIRWYNEKRIKLSLGSPSPIGYREKLGQVC